MKAARYLLVLVSLRIALVHAQITTFKNVVVIFQENRTPDNLFQGLCTTPTACSITPTGKQYNIQTSNWLEDKHEWRIAIHFEADSQPVETRVHQHTIQQRK